MRRTSCQSPDVETRRVSRPRGWIALSDVPEGASRTGEGIVDVFIMATTLPVRRRKIPTPASGTSQLMESDACAANQFTPHLASLVLHPPVGTESLGSLIIDTESAWAFAPLLCS